LEPNLFDLDEKRYLLDQALDHELDALIATLQHNLQVIGYPIECRSIYEHNSDNLDGQSNLFKKPMHSYSNLQRNAICYVDALGSSYLMPCLAQNPC